MRICKWVKVRREYWYETATPASRRVARYKRDWMKKLQIRIIELRKEAYGHRGWPEAIKREEEWDPKKCGWWHILDLLNKKQRFIEMIAYDTLTEKIKAVSLTGRFEGPSITRAIKLGILNEEEKARAWMYWEDWIENNWY